MRPNRARFRGQGVFFDFQSWASCITNIFGFDFRQAQAAIGTVKWFNATKGYGFIEPHSGGISRRLASFVTSNRLSWHSKGHLRRRPRIARSIAVPF
jgi:hypothetical protein